MKTLKRVFFLIGLLLSFGTWAESDCTFFVDDTQFITSNETIVSRQMADSTMVALENGVATIGTFRARLLDKGDQGLDLTIADSYSGTEMSASFERSDLIMGAESGAALKVKLSESRGNFEVGSVLYIGAKKTLVREASVYCFE